MELEDKLLASSSLEMPVIRVNLGRFLDPNIGRISIVQSQQGRNPYTEDAESSNIVLVGNCAQGI